MTAEVAIINSNAVAIAADSAVTIGRGRKIYNSAIKVFSLSKISPVGIMVYGNAGLLGVPWETIIKMYRSQLKNKTFDTLEAHAEHFLRFLRTQQRLFPKELQTAWIESNVRGYFTFIRDEYFELVQNEIKNQGEISDQKTQDIFNDCVVDHTKRLKALQFVRGMTKSDEASVLKVYRKNIRQIMAEIFEGIKLNRGMVTKLNQTACFIHTRAIFSESSSGVVVSGFGNNDIYPVVSTYEVEGILGKKLKYRFRKDKSHRIVNGSDCSIIPFAQDDMVALFMEGLNPAVNEFIEKYLSQLFGRLPELIDEKQLSGSKTAKKRIINKFQSDAQKLLERFINQLRTHKHIEHVGPILSMVQVLPKDELAAMAEALVNLTAFKRRMTDELETVGGPIDVAVISKGDGLVWVDRKHYFPKELNQHFFANYFRDVNDEK